MNPRLPIQEPVVLSRTAQEPIPLFCPAPQDPRVNHGCFLPREGLSSKANGASHFRLGEKPNQMVQIFLTPGPQKQMSGFNGCSHEMKKVTSRTGLYFFLSVAFSHQRGGARAKDLPA
jgi:hypothetical protein